MSSSTIALVAKEVTRVNKSHVNSDHLMGLKIKELQEKNHTFKATNSRLDMDVQDLKEQMKSLPTNFGKDWKPVFDSSLCGTQPILLIPP